MTTEQSVIGGRETFGEPKKLGQVTLERDGDHVVGTIARMGTTIVEIEGTVGAPVEAAPTAPAPTSTSSSCPRPTARASTTRRHSSTAIATRRPARRTRCTARLTLRESRFDPVADLPCRRLLDITLAERRSVQRGEIVGRVPAEWIIPYVHQRYDDLSPIGED